MSMLDDDVILIGSGSGAESIHEQLKTKSKFFQYYKFVRVSNDSAANVLCFNGKVIAPATYKSLCQDVPELVENSKVIWAEADEFEKIDGALTCRSVFFDHGDN